METVHEELEGNIMYLLSDREAGSRRWCHQGACERQNTQKLRFCSNCCGNIGNILSLSSFVQQMWQVWGVLLFCEWHTDYVPQWQPLAVLWCRRCKYKKDDLQKIKYRAVQLYTPDLRSIQVTTFSHCVNILLYNLELGGHTEVRICFMCKWDIVKSWSKQWCPGHDKTTTHWITKIQCADKTTTLRHVWSNCSG